MQLVPYLYDSPYYLTILQLEQNEVRWDEIPFEWKAHKLRKYILTYRKVIYVPKQSWENIKVSLIYYFPLFKLNILELNIDYLLQWFSCLDIVPELAVHEAANTITRSGYEYLSASHSHYSALFYFRPTIAHAYVYSK